MIAAGGPLADVLRTLVIVSVSVIALLAIARAARTRRNSAARPAWVASVFAVLGLLTLDVVIPLTDVDTVLGGVNLWNLIQAVCSTTSFWFFYRSTRLLAYGPDTRQPSQWWWIGSILTQVVCFAFIPDKTGTPATFVQDHADGLACYLYLTVYIASIGIITALSAWAVRDRIRSIFGLFFTGYLLIVVAAGSHLVYLTLMVTTLVSPADLEPLRLSFYALFLPGVGVLAAGFAGVFLRARFRTFQPRWRVRAYRVEMLAREIEGLPTSRRAGLRAALSAAPRAAAAAATTIVYDAVIDEDAVLTSRDRSLIEEVNSDVLRHLGVQDELAQLSEVIR